MNKINIHDWEVEFKSLSNYQNSRFIKILGPLICGVELIKLPRSQGYRPHFVIYPLYKSNIKECLKSPLLIDEYLNKLGNQISIPFNVDRERLRTFQSMIKNSTIFDIEKTSYTVSSVINTTEYYLNEHRDILFKRHPGLRANLFLIKYISLLFVGVEDRLSIVLNDIKSDSQTWDLELFSKWHGNLEEWLTSLEIMRQNREEFMKKIEINSDSSELWKIKRNILLI